MPDLQTWPMEIMPPDNLSACISNPPNQSFEDDEIDSLPPNDADQLADHCCRLIRQSSSNEERRGLLKKAIVLLEHALTKGGENKYISAGFKLASIYLHYSIDYDDGYVPKGLAVLEKLGVMQPQDARIDFMASQFHLCVGNNDEAERMFLQAEKKNMGKDLEWPQYAFHLADAAEEVLTRKYGGILTFKQTAARNGRFSLSNAGKLSRELFNELTGLDSGGKSESKTPYSSLPSRTAFWKTAVAECMPNTLADFYHKKFPITPAHKIMSAGSCFAQHIGKTLKEAGFNFLDYEPAFKQKHFLANIVSRGFGYDLYSARYGNIYTPRQLLQLFLRSFDRFGPAEEFWTQNSRWFDPFRPTIEPNGFLSLIEAQTIRRAHLAAVKRLFLDSDVLIFTLGLTEAWQHKGDGSVYPVCPGVAAGAFDSEKYEFKNFSHDEIVADLETLFLELRAVNPQIKFLLTVSPVPLTATASGDHILAAVMKSKSILRSAAATVYDKFDFVDYFPSYDVISSIAFGRGAFAENLREVKPEVVKFIMSRFLEAHGVEKNTAAPRSPQVEKPASGLKSKEDEFCDEILLEVYNK